MAAQQDIKNQSIHAVNARTSLDRWTVMGMGGGLFLVLFAITINGELGAFFDGASVMIVVLGTLLLTAACYSAFELRNAWTHIRGAFRRTAVDPDKVALQLITIAELTRQKGLLSLQGSLVNLESQELLQRGLGMAVDGAPFEEVENVLRQEVAGNRSQRTTSVEVVRKAGDLSPAMGLIGTLIGLIQLLGNLDDPSSIGPAMAVALVTTFYGACMANIFFIPLATKMERNAESDNIVDKLYMQAVVSILRNENPRRLEMLLNTVLPAHQRVSFYD